MLRIRSAQWEPFTQEAVLDFERRMLEHVRAFFPDEWVRMGEVDVRAMIRHGIERAGDYGIRTERGVCSYIDVMFGHGRDFDRDPALPWAAEMLNDDSYAPEDRAERVFDAAFPFANDSDEEDAAFDDEHDHDDEGDDEDDDDEEDGPESEDRIDEAAVRQELEVLLQRADEVMGDG